MRWTGRTSTVIAVAVATVVSGAVVGSTEPAEPASRGLAADIRYTEYGVPHIKAADFAGLGYGYGFAAAKDNICALADIYVTVGARRSRYFGPDTPGNDAYGATTTSLASDLYYQQVNDSGVVERALAQPAPRGPRREVREIIRGYVAGYNRYLHDAGARGVTDPACRGGAWLRPIAEIDVYRHVHALSTLSGEGAMVDAIAAAQPPSANTPKKAVPANAVERVRTALGRGDMDGDMGSNAIAIGSAGTVHGGGLLLGNPHFPWHGGRRFWQSQLTVPGKFDVSGASLLGMPLVQIGFNRDVAWSHTVSTANPMGFYEVPLVAGDPTTYLVDGEPERMTSRRVAVPVRRPDGSLGTVERTFYATRYGPVVSGAFGLPFEWTAASAFAVRDANLGNLHGLNTWFEFARARGTGDLVDVMSRTQGVPWVNTIAADRSGNALYADMQVVAHVTDELAKQCNTPFGGALFEAAGIPVLDGSRVDCAWGNDPDALVPGTFGPSRMPVLTRADYVENSNDSPWLSNPHQPITGYPRIMGDVATERDGRTRMGITEIEEQLDQGGFDRRSMQDMLFANRSWHGGRAAADTAAMCESFPGGRAPTSDGGTVEVGNACAALSNWDQRMTVRSRGALLFERYWLRAGGVSAAELWRVQFDPADPVGTPNTLNTAHPVVQQALGDAIAELRAAGVDPNARLGDDHYVVRNGKRYPVHGGHAAQGVLNMIIPTWDPERGATEVEHGSSHIHVVSFTGRTCPDAATLLTYSQSANPNSRHHADQTALFSTGRWVRSRFCERDILTSPALRVVRLRAP